MTFTTENAAEMRARRGRPPAVKPMVTAPHQAAETAPAERATTAPAERAIPLVLKSGWWAYDGTIYMDGHGRSQVYRTPMTATGEVDEMARKRLKFAAGTRIEVPASVARSLIDGGKATLDVGV